MAKATAANDNPTRYALKPKIAAAYATIATLRNDATNYWQSFSCPAFGGTSLKGVIASCTAADGTNWAIESRGLGASSRSVAGDRGAASSGIQLVRWTGADPGRLAPRGITSLPASDVTLGVNGRGEAMVNYRAQGRTFHVLVSSGAVQPAAPSTQVAFQFAYDGGYSKYFRQSPQAQEAARRTCATSRPGWRLRPRSRTTPRAGS